MALTYFETNKLVFRVYLDGEVSLDSSPYDDEFEQFIWEPVMAVKHMYSVGTHCVLPTYAMTSLDQR